MTLMNRLANAKNEYQGDRERVLCVCSAGLLRSPTLAYVLQQEPYNKNTRAAGSSSSFALVPVDPVLLHWADTVIFVNKENFIEVNSKFEDFLKKKEVVVLNIPDEFPAFDPVLIERIKEELNRFDYV
jgi:predicted protein tyrosine phosphatase